MIWSEGDLWKRTRSLFNPGFAASHLMNLVPTIVDDTMVFWQNLDKIAETKEIVQLEHISSHLTIDIMGHVILDHDLNAQTGRNRLVEGFQNAISWTPSAKTINPFAGLNPIRPFAHWYWTRVMDTYLEKIIRERYQMLKSGSIDQSQKCAIDLALIQYDEQQAAGKDVKAEDIDKTTMQLIIDGMKTFLFAGHDTSSSTLCYVYYLLELNPKCLVKVIQEHNEVFGQDTSITADIIKNNPQLLNKLPYTLAVIKGELIL
jgi:cytochrome P450